MPKTTRIPTGEYPLPAAVHHLDLGAEAAELVARMEGRRETRNLAREAGVSVLLMVLEKGEGLDEHSADGTVIVQVLQGRAAMQTDEELIELRPGGLVMFQPDARHDLTAAERSVILLIVTGGNP